MIIPVRCFTCHKVLGDKWEYYKEKVDAIQTEKNNKKIKKEDLIVKDKMSIFFSDDFKGKILDELNIKKICCRRHMLGHVDLIDLI